MFDKQLNVESEGVMIEILSEEYIKNNSHLFGEVIIPPGEALQIMVDGKPDHLLKSDKEAFKVKAPETTTPEPKKKKGFLSKSKPIKATNESLDLTKGNVRFILANIKPTKYRIEFICRTSDFALLRGLANVEAHIDENNLASLLVFEGEALDQDYASDFSKGKYKVVSIADVEHLLSYETSIRVGGLLSNVSSKDLFDNNYRDSIRKAVEEMRPDWLKLGFVVENIRVDFQDTVYENSMVYKKTQEDTEIKELAEYEANIKRYQREKEIRDMKTADELDLELKKATMQKEIQELERMSNIEEYVKDREHQRKLEIMRAEADLAQSHKGYLEGYLDGYRAGQREMYQYMNISNGSVPCAPAPAPTQAVLSNKKEEEKK